ncbi:MAG: hypothetical protein E6G97_24275 [Alphaproteobacteria bacterium]|nr:MAG: hypothetical protein E6G97_24275 [Alphaproteobacteria bacterium]
MGASGTGLYSSDMAADMRAAIKSALRLPVDEDRIVEILSDCERGAATDPGNEDHTTFWLVLADQFEQRGVAHAPTREKAIAIIDRGDDLAMMERRGMKQADLRKRGDKLAELRARLAAAPRVSKPRATIKTPEPYVLELGVLYACPVQGSSCISPYRGKKNYDGSPWSPDGWRQFVVLNRGRAFDYLAWYHPLVAKKPIAQKPRLADAGVDFWWELDTPKTCPRRHFDRMEIAAIGTLPIDMEKAGVRFAKRGPGYVHLGCDGRSWAVNEVTIADSMHASSHDWERWYAPKGLLPEEGPRMMRNLAGILAD